MKTREKTIFSILLFALLAVAVVSTIAASSLGKIPSVSAQTTNGFSPPQNLSNDGYNASYPWVANSGPNVYIAWTEEAHGIYFRASLDNGSTWNPPLDSPGLRISTQGGTAGYPIVSASGSDVYIAWSQSVNNVLQIFFAGSTNNGSNFSAPIQLTSGTSSNGWITPVIASSGQYVYIAFTGNGLNSYVTSSSNYGATWTTPFHYAGAHEPQITASGTSAYVVSDGPAYAATHNGGASWTEVMNATNNGDEPWIASSGSNVYIVSQTKTPNGIIHFITCSNNGMNCSPNVPGKDISPGINDSWEPQMIASGNYVYVTFHTLTARIVDWYTYSSNNGATWSTPINLTDSNHLVGWAPQLATSGCGGGYSCSGPNNYVYTEWPVRNSLNSPYWSMFASVSSDYGATWTPVPGINVSVGIYGSSGPNDIATSSAAANGNHMFLVWGDNSTGNSQVIFSESNPNFTLTTTTSAPPTTGFTVLPTTSTTGVATTTSGFSHSTSTAVSISLPPPTTTSSAVNVGDLSVPAVDYYLLAIAVAIVVIAAASIFAITRKRR